MCAVRVPAAWLAASETAGGPLFRPVDQLGHVGAPASSERSVALVVQHAAERAGLDPKIGGRHSLRAGFATAAAKKVKSLQSRMRQTLHRSEKVARGASGTRNCLTTTRP